MNDRFWYRRRLKSNDCSGSTSAVRLRRRERPECWANLAFSAARVNRRVGWEAGLPDLPNFGARRLKAAIHCPKPRHPTRCLFVLPLVGRQTEGYPSFMG